MIGGTNLAIGISLILRDQFSGRMAQANQQLNRTQRQALAAERSSLQSQRNISAAGALSGAVALGAMREWVKVGANFDKQMVYTYSIVDGASSKSGITLKRLKDQAVQVGQDTMFSTTQVAEAMTSMGQAGQNVEQIYKNINSVAVLAAATMSDIQLSASAMNDIMIGFDIKASEENSMMVADIVTQSINKSNIQLKDFSESMKYIIPTAKTLNMELGDVATIIAAVGNAGIKGSMAGTNTENMLRYLSTAAGGNKKKQVESLAQLGMKPGDLRDAQGNMLPIAQIIERIGTALQRMNNIDRVNVMTDLFGVRGQRPAMLLAQQLSRYSEMKQEVVGNSAGTAQKTANDVMGTLFGSMERLDSTWESFKISFTEAIQPVLIPLLTVITKILQGVVGVLKQPWGKTLAIIAAGFILWRTAAFAISTITMSIRLYQLGVMQSGLAMGNTMVNQYNRMTTAASRYNQTVGMGMGMGAGGGRMGNLGLLGTGFGRNNNPAVYLGRNGQYYSTATGSRVSAAVGRRWESIYGGRVRAESRWGWAGRANNAIGKASPYMMLGGMGLGVASSAMGPESETGQWLGVGASALGMAGTGAMIGSMFPGIGTAVGAVVGGVAGLAMGINSKLENDKAQLDAAKAEIDASKDNPVIDAQWVQDAKSIMGMRPNGTYVKFTGEQGFNPAEQQYWQQRAQTNQQMWLPGQSIKGSNHIVVNINGDKAFDKIVNENNYNANVNWGF